MKPYLRCPNATPVTACCLGIELWELFIHHTVQYAGSVGHSADTVRILSLVVGTAIQSSMSPFNLELYEGTVRLRDVYGLRTKLPELCGVHQTASRWGTFFHPDFHVPHSAPTTTMQYNRQRVCPCVC